MSSEQIVVRLTGRPEIERTPWIVTPNITQVGYVTIITTEGIKKCVPTGHTIDGMAVWVPEDKREDWPPHHQRLINILKDEDDE
jgi:hypothetical protein